MALLVTESERHPSGQNWTDPAPSLCTENAGPLLVIFLYMCPTALLLKCILSQAALQVNPSFLCRIPELAGCLSSLRNLACGGLINFFRTHINRFKMFLLSQRIKVPPAISALHQKNSHSQCAKILPKALLPSSAFTNAGLQAS